MCSFCETKPPQIMVSVQRSDDCAEPPEIIDEVLCHEDIDPRHLYEMIGVHDHIHLAWIDWFGVEPVLTIDESEKGANAMLIKYCPLCNRNLMEEK